MKILLLDDSNTALFHLQAIINQVLPDAAIYAYDNYAEALESLESNTFDIAFLDLQLPDKNGADLMMHIKSKKKFKDLQIVIVTGTGEKSLLQTSIEKHVTAYLHKPVDKSEITRLLA